MLQILALHYCSYFRTEYTHPPFHSLDAEPLLFTNATERGCAGDNKKKSYILSGDSAMQEEGWFEGLLLTQWCVHPSI